MTSTKNTEPERIATELRDKILAGEIPPATPLREELLSKQYDVSRHVIRESLRSLAAEGFADYSAFKGARVTFVSAEEVKDIYDTREFLENSALSLPNIQIDISNLARLHGRYVNAVKAKNWPAAFELDMEFHSAIVEVCGSKRIQELHRELFRSLRLAHLIAPEFREFGLTASVAEHAEIVVAIGASDWVRARTVLNEHLSEARKLLIDRLHHE